MGFLFLDAPPEERLSLPDFRSIGDNTPEKPSPELLDVLHEAETRQDWYRDYLIAREAEPLDFVGVLADAVPVIQAATRIRNRIGLTVDQRLEAESWEAALTGDIGRIEAAGILVMRSGIVGNNTHRPLSVDEFRGFAIADPIAPLIFLNGRDAKAAQNFTLMHELVHIWAGRSGVFNFAQTFSSDVGAERHSNAIAAELLVPEDPLRELVRNAPDIDGDTVVRLVRRFKVSSLVVLRRLYDIQALTWDEFRAMYVAEEERFQAVSARQGGGGDFYRTQQTRSSKRLAAAVIEDTLEGNTPQRDAMRLLGIRSVETFNEMARRLGITV